MKTATFDYRCRRCGTQFKLYGINENVALLLLVSAILTDKTTLPPDQRNHSPELIEPHDCANNGMGVADLLGYSLD